MTNIAKIRRLIQSFNFDGLFEELGWDRFKKALTVSVDGSQYDLTSVRQKRGFQVYHYLVPDGDEFPKAAVMAKIQREVAKTAHENLVIFSDEGQTRQCFRIAKREEGKLLRSTGLDFYKNHSGEALAQRLSRIAISLDEEDELTLVDVANRASELYAERVTRSFFAQFKTQRDTFKEFISGIQDVQQQEWYASLMLNRLMFVYFVQKKGFLDRDLDYLKNRLAQSREANKDFHSFYQYFLLRLFHDGLNKRPDDRDPELEKLLGEVPYLNGGIFGEHEIEQLHNEIEIPDEAFENLFEFFDDYQWHLDDRELRSDREINPDVLGYIFEKYINQKQMGAYYTKEDITEYISKNTILPYLFDEAARRNNEPFHPDREVWALLRDDPDRYIYDAVGHGIFVNVHTGQELDKPAVLPANIAAGISDVTKRADWNAAAPPEVALPTETWREHIARRDRCVDLRAKLKAGEVTSINDLVTLNLNIRQFAQDVIDNCESADLLRAIYYTIAGRPEQSGSNHKAQLPLSVLDPTCGSGAFLFAAVNILQPLYEACLTKMQQFVTDADNVAPVTVDDEVAALIELGESATIEFKSTARWDVKTAESLADMPAGQRLEILKKKDKDRQHDILKAAAALLNTKGGDLVIGVTDDGTGYGVHHDYAFFSSESKQNRDHYELWLMGLFKEQFGKVAAGCIEPVFARRDGQDVVWLKISPSPDPAIVKKDGSEVFYRRIGNSSESLGMNEYATYREQRFKGDPPQRVEPKLKLAKASKSTAKQLKDFRAILEDVDKHLNRTYFVLKSIIINNLYGVDIMPEAVEICKLRLFLKLMSTVDPQYSKQNMGVEALPDIDFNIRAGNTLIGYATEKDLEESSSSVLSFEPDKLRLVKKQLRLVARAFRDFRRQQTTEGGEITQQHKLDLIEELRTLSEDLDIYLATEFGVDVNSARALKKWKLDHLPFHWIAEFYEIIDAGGFDVIVGNPPYVEIEKSWNRQHLTRLYSTALERWSRDEDVYTLVMERSDKLLDVINGRYGLIVPLSLAFSTKRTFELLRSCLAESKRTWWFSHFDRIPDALFGNNVRTRCTIALKDGSPNASTSFCTTPMQRWTADARPYLFPGIGYAEISTSIRSGLPKVGSQTQASVLSSLQSNFKKLSECLLDSLSFTQLARLAPDFPAKSVYIGGTAYNWFPAWREIPETTTINGDPSLPARTAGYRFRTDKEADVVFALLCSSLGYWWWAVASDGFNLKRWLIESFPFNPEGLSSEANAELAVLGKKLRRELKLHYVFKDNRGRIGNFYLPACLETVYEIDNCLADHMDEISSDFIADIQDFNRSFSTASLGEES